MTIPKKIASLILVGLITTVAHAQSPGQPVSPKQSFSSSILNIHAPDSEGWIITAVAGNGISFGKKGTVSGETYGAQVVFFELPLTTGNEEFVSFVKKRIATMNPPPRFQETDSNYHYIEDRGYPCVDARINLDDTAAVTPTGREQLKLQVISLYCRHPEQQQVGFFAAYSHRGKVADDQIESAAKNFIETINVPKK
ncbi:hypothetical protein [Propionivibrio sp.]|uniref:hypothetical protein n=1 Tax=Propionivibrio sp. TaxID=2212460 RepID=UPI0039E46112